MASRAVAILSGALLRQELHRRHLTQRAFAAHVGLRQATISAAVRGRPLSPELIYRIALGLGLAEVPRRG